MNLLANGEKGLLKRTHQCDRLEKKASQVYQKFKDGKEIVYTLQEEKVAEYTTTIDQAAYTITNTHAPGKTSITVTKWWDDEMTRIDYFVRRAFTFSFPMLMMIKKLAKK